jgi:hypothetical protein
MKKNDLIKKLQEIEGNPDVLLYNGFVDDWMHIEIIKHDLHRLKKDALIRIVAAQEGCSIEETEKRLKNHSREWDIDTNHVFDGDKLHETKSAIFIQGKTRGKTSWDRSGTSSY